MKGMPFQYKEWKKAFKDAGVTKFSNAALEVLRDWYDVQDCPKLDPEDWCAIQAIADNWTEYTRDGLWREFAKQYFKEDTWDKLAEILEGRDEVSALIDRMQHLCINHNKEPLFHRDYIVLSPNGYNGNVFVVSKI